MTTEDLQLFIESKVPGTYQIGNLQPSPDDVILVRMTGGPKAAVDFLRTPTFQVLTRAKTYQEAERMIYAVYDALDGVLNALIGGDIVHHIEATSEPVYLLTDKQGRHEWSVVFRMTKER